MPYSRSSSPFDQAGNYLRHSQTPVTLTIIVVCALMFLVSFFTHAPFLNLFFVFETPVVSPLQLIALFTYPLLNPDFIQVTFACVWLFGIGGSLERSWGSGKYGAFFVLISAASGIGLWLGTLLLRHHVSMSLDIPLIGGLWIPVTSLTVAWAAINPTQSIMLYGVVSIQARWIALFLVGVIYFVYYAGAPVLGLFVLTGALGAYLVVKLGTMSAPVYRGGSGPDLRIINGGQNRRRPLDDAGLRISLNPIDRYRAWQQRRKIAKMMEKSGFSDRNDEKRRR